MDDSSLRYDKWVEDALRGVIARALRHVADSGLPGEHHFYVTFRTTEGEADIPDFLRAQYPEEMTIVLQHQFWDLLVGEDMFEVTLSFGGRRQRLCVPYDSITAFADPAVNFGLQLKQIQLGEGTEDEPLPTDEDFAAAGDDILIAGSAAGADEATSQDDAGKETAPSGEVITLDAFRKK